MSIHFARNFALFLHFSSFYKINTWFPAFYFLICFPFLPHFTKFLQLFKIVPASTDPFIFRSLRTSFPAVTCCCSVSAGSTPEACVQIADLPHLLRTSWAFAMPARSTAAAKSPPVLFSAAPEKIPDHISVSVRRSPSVAAAAPYSAGIAAHILIPAFLSFAVPAAGICFHPPKDPP